MFPAPPLRNPNLPPSIKDSHPWPPPQAATRAVPYDFGPRREEKRSMPLKLQASTSASWSNTLYAFIASPTA
jgi:hypothetical protein